MDKGNLTDNNLTSNETSKVFRHSYVQENQLFWLVNTVLCVLVGALAILSNGLTLVARHKCRDILNKKPYILVNTLACADFSLGLQMIFLVFGSNSGYCENNLLQLINDIPLYTLVVSSVLHACAMTAERYCAISYPLHYEAILTERKLYMVSCLCWLISALFALPIYIWSGFSSPSGECGPYKNKAPFLYKTGLLLSLYFVVGMVFIIFYLKILIIIRRQAIRIATEATVSNGFRQMKMSQKGTRVVMVILVAYLVCWGPNLVNQLIDSLYVYDQTRNISRLTLTFGMMNSCINAFAYAYINQDYRKAYKRLLCCKAT